MGGSLFDIGPTDETPPEREGVLVAAYMQAGRTLDDLPYTAEFDRLVASARENGDARSPRELLHSLHTMRKAGALPKAGKSSGTPPKIGDDEERLLAELVVRAVGTLGKRDQLPYTEAFDVLVDHFNRQTARALDPYSVWRLVAKLAK